MIFNSALVMEMSFCCVRDCCMYATRIRVLKYVCVCVCVCVCVSDGTLSVWPVKGAAGAHVCPQNWNFCAAFEKVS